jgi:CheY-like chemotaxis protein
MAAPDRRKVHFMPIETGTNDVIVADNDYIVRNILRSLLEGEGLTVLSAIHGLEALSTPRAP